MPQQKFLFSKMPTWEILEASGPDACDFLHRLTSANFKNLKPGTFTRAALLQATGKITLYFKALCLTPERYLLLAAGQNTLEHFEKMHFMEDLKLSNQTSKWAYYRTLGSQRDVLERLPTPWNHAAQVLSAKTFAQIPHEKGQIFALAEQAWTHSPLVFDLGLVVDSKLDEELQIALQSNGFELVSDLEPYRLRAIDPAAPHELNATVIPLEAGIDDAVHENKGCYPGQEVIERIRSMGQPPRKLAQFWGEGKPPCIPAKILWETQEAGALTSAAADPFENGWVGLGFLKKNFVQHAKESGGASFSVDGRAVQARLKETK